MTKRSAEEVAFLNTLFADRLRKLADNVVVHSHRIRVRVLGSWDVHLSAEAQEGARVAMTVTERYQERSLTLLLAYDGVREMVSAVRRLVEAARRDDTLVVNAESIKARLITRELPAVDLLIRTGSEPHLSAGFLMWEMADAQLVFSDRLWPDYTPDDLAAAVFEYRRRERRFGA